MITKINFKIDLNQKNLINNLEIQLIVLSILLHDYETFVKTKFKTRKRIK